MYRHIGKAEKHWFTNWNLVARKTLPQIKPKQRHIHVYLEGKEHTVSRNSEFWQFLFPDTDWYIKCKSMYWITGEWFSFMAS
jgi:hypothetical protein